MEPPSSQSDKGGNIIHRSIHSQNWLYHRSSAESVKTYSTVPVWAVSASMLPPCQKHTRALLLWGNSTVIIHAFYYHSNTPTHATDWRVGLLRKGRPLDFSADAWILDATLTGSPTGHYSNPPELLSPWDKSRPLYSKHAGRRELHPKSHSCCRCTGLYSVYTIWKVTVMLYKMYAWISDLSSSRSRKHWLQAQIKVGHVQPLLADLPSGCLYFLKNCRQHTLLLPSYSVPTLQQQRSQ